MSRGIPVRCLAWWCLLVLALCAFKPAVLPCADAPEIELRILGTGEIHATPDSCDCPLNPVGGLARLAGLLKTEWAKVPSLTIIIDTGGWAAGG
ncbi:MAG TPA: hypothetical protein VL860_02965, partial [Planctomycetota bacterium]|nr:hypothetical protein [Planctomycetota bacterium]